MSNGKKLDPTGERAAATEAVETTPISGKEHEYRADGDHHPRQVSDAGEGDKDDVQAERRISKGIPGAGERAETHAAAEAKRDRNRPD